MQVVWSKQNNNNRLNHGVTMQSKDLTEYFSENLFVANLKAKTKAKSLEELSDLFVANKVIRTKGIVLEMLNQRETLGSTGIGKGVAIPHGRTTAALDVTIAFGKSKNGIDFDSVDKELVKLIFVVLAPPQDDNNRYLPVLGKLVEVVHDKANREKLLQAKTFEELMQVFEEVG